MDPNYLLKDELEYELECRGVILQSTVPVLKRVLKELLIVESSDAPGHEVKAPVNSVRSVKSELDICTKKLGILSSYISELVGKPDKALFKRLVSRLYHVQNRVSLIVELEDDEGVRKDALEQQCQVLLEKLEGQDDGCEDEHLTADDEAVLQQSLGDLGVKIVEKLNIAGRSTEPDAGSIPESGNAVKLEDNSASNKSVYFGIGHRNEHLGRTGTFTEEIISEAVLSGRVVSGNKSQDAGE
ncbi:uncharacterized protein LOC125232990 [Leguminivora glycinivorella]|uniref:uncharacterized protein LOC125232990 n=1 Tax=Leguminivora glycinivorella TaxID=1035111 RepID=UPI00200F60F5|nr:uncharacterized protein LOC125232990 [Leguminivora glycinivorella]